MEGLRHPMTQENKFIGQACKRKHRSYRDAENPFTGSLLERQILRAHYCLTHDCPDLEKLFIAETGMTPQQFIDKWEEILL